MNKIYIIIIYFIEISQNTIYNLIWSEKMKILKKISSIIIVLTIILSCFIFTTYAANNATLFFSKNTIEQGDKLTVSVSVNPNVSMSELSFYLQYDADVLKYESGDGTASKDGVVDVFKNPNGEKSVRYSFVFTANTEGKSAISVVDCLYKTSVDGEATEKKFTGASATVKVKGTSNSDNANLKSIKIDGYKLSSNFSKNKTSYSLKVPYDVKNINITATPQDDSANVTIDGNNNLKVGNNKVTLTVKAQNGKQKKYTINVKRQEKEDETDSSENSSSEETAQTYTTGGLQTLVDGKSYIIITEIPKNALFKGFEIEKTNVNGYTIDTAVDSKANYRVFYLKEIDSEDLVPYLYDNELDSFIPLKHITIGENTYIIEKLPEDLNYPKNLYPSNIPIGTFNAECLSDTDVNMNDFKYVYCYNNGFYNLYRYDTKEQTLQRYPDLENQTAKTGTDNVFSRFGTLSTNGKIIIIALLIVILGILSLLILLIVYLIRRSINRNEEILLYNDDDFDEVQVTNENKNED